jgi:ketosteroid isomerase-like protein
MKPVAVAMRFVDRINAHDVSGLVDLMTSDHLFTDSLGVRTTRPAIEKGWKQYFAMVPDYSIRIECTLSRKGLAVLVGSAGGTYVPKGGVLRRKNRWASPAVWVARVRGKKVAEWRVYSDNEPIRTIMRASSA